jgi:hypothetical protein
MTKEELAAERLAARAAKDFAKADQLRDQIAALGFEIVDVAGGYEFRPISLYPTYSTLQEIKPIKVKGEIALAMIIDGFLEDALTTVQNVKANCAYEIVLLVKTDPAALLGEIDSRTHLIELSSNFGWGECANTLLKNVTSKYLIIMDPSTRFTGDAITPALAELNKGEYNAVGWRGGLVNIQDEWRSVDDKGPGEVDVLFSYFLALNRADALSVDGFNNRAIYYRNADMEFSLKLRHSNGRLLQMDLPLEQDRHHGYYDTDPEFREVQSKKNYDRILERFRGKEAILSPRR